MATRKQAPANQRVAPRVIVKLVSGMDARANAVVKALRDTAGVAFKPAFEDEPGIRAMSVPPFDRYLVAQATDRRSADAMVRALQRLEGVEIAYVEAGPVDPPVSPADDPRFASQGYLTAAPDGIDAVWAWSISDGGGVGFVDLERGWTLNHEDLVAANITIISGLNQDFQSHGTAVLGEVLAVDNAIGGVGIAPRCTGRVVSQWQTSTNYRTAAAILSAGQVMNAGDVLLLEAQTSSGSTNKLPVEVEALVADAIRHVVDDGIIVIEAAGNGSNDLDTFVDGANHRILDRNSNDFVDTGAIMVGAASSAAPHTRLNFSNFGSRIDCYAWGENIDTTGGSGGAGTTAYTSSFSGTSGASPIVTGAALLLQSWRIAQGNTPYTADEMRSLLINPTFNTASADPANDRIGVMPNLRAIFEYLRRIRFDRPQYESWVYILFGIIDDAPGVIWVPGKGPVPVDPGWGRRIPEQKRDLLAALAANEIASKIGNRGMRDKLMEASLAAMREAVERVGRMR
jgi:hypothetical protein